VGMPSPTCSVRSIPSTTRRKKRSSGYSSPSTCESDWHKSNESATAHSLGRHVLAGTQLDRRAARAAISGEFTPTHKQPFRAGSECLDLTVLLIASADTDLRPGGECIINGGLTALEATPGDSVRHSSILRQSPALAPNLMESACPRAAPLRDRDFAA
jgi:hypothetical protein